MQSSIIVSLLALAVSILSLIVSKRSFDRAGRIHEQSQAEAGAKRKRELLVLMSDCRSTLDETRVKIGALKATYDAESQPVRVLLQNYTGLFTEYMPAIERALAQIAVNRKSVENWSGDIPYADLERKFAEYYDDLKTFQFSDARANSLIGTFKEKFALAKEYTLHARR